MTLQEIAERFEAQREWRTSPQYLNRRSEKILAWLKATFTEEEIHELAVIDRQKHPEYYK